MKNPKRITVALDEESAKILDQMTDDEDTSKSELVRKTLKFYQENKELLENNREKLETYLNMLSKGEHVILDIDRWLLFLEMLESSEESKEFWKKAKRIANSHAEQLNEEVNSFEDLLKRLEACNFYEMDKVSENEFTLMVSSKEAKKFVKKTLEDFSESMGFEVNIIEDIGKLRAKIEE